MVKGLKLLHSIKYLHALKQAKICPSLRIGNALAAEPVLRRIPRDEKCDSHPNSAASQTHKLLFAI